MFRESLSGDYWEAKKPLFAAVAEDVLARHKDSEAYVLYVADFLSGTLGRFDRGIDILLDAHRRGMLHQAGQLKLIADLLQYSPQRGGELVPILEPFVAREPDDLQYVDWLMRAYFAAGRKEQRLDLAKKTEAALRASGLWEEDAMAALGEICLASELFEPAIACYREAIACHGRNDRGKTPNGPFQGQFVSQPLLRQHVLHLPNPPQGGNRPVKGLPDYYNALARAYSGLKMIAEAADAASAAIAAGGPRFGLLEEILRDVPDVDAFAAELDRRADESGRENTLVRKALSLIYREKKEYAKAIRQLDRAAEAQPNDEETYQLLLACYDAEEDKAGAVRQLLRQREWARRDIHLYEDLAYRYEDFGKPEEAERAVTSIVEVQPLEAESHQLLAEIRERQDRWDDAIVQWRHVARIRALEPEGLISLAEALIHERRWAEAAEVAARLKQTAWPVRADSSPEDLRAKMREMEGEIECGRK